MMSCGDRIRTEDKYLNVRKQLDDLGYHQVLGVESVSLVERLLANLLHVTDCLNHYRDLTEKCLESQKDYELGVEPYRHDNARLIQECNKLHMKILYQQEESERNVRELKKKIRQLENEKGELVFLNSQYLARVNQLELECIQKSNSLLQLKTPRVMTTKKKVGSQSSVKTSALCRGQGDGQYVADDSKSLDQQVHSLTEILSQMKDDCQQHSELINSLKLQIDARDLEVERLLGLLEGGRPLRAVCKDYLHCAKENKVHTLEEELKTKEDKIKSLEDELKEVTSNLHEAMSRAMSLADRNKELEEHLNGMSSTHRSVASLSAKEANNTLISLQEQLRSREELGERLERDLQAARHKCRQLETSLEATQSDKQWLESRLDSMLEEKHKMVNRIDQFHIVEQDMLEEIGRLKHTNIQQRHRVLDLQSQLKQSGVVERASQTVDSGNDSRGERESSKLQDNCRVSKVQELQHALTDKDRQLAELQQEVTSLRTQLKQSASSNQVGTCYDTPDAQLKEQLSTTLAELSQQRILYNQIKLLQQQTDGALAEMQAQLLHTTKELTATRDRLTRLEQEHHDLQKEVSCLKSEVSTLRQSLMQVDQEKDALLISMDAKTEQAAAMDQLLEEKECQVKKLKESVADLQKQLSLVTDDSATRSQATKALQRMLETVREELDMVQQSKDLLVRDNRRLKEDLAAVTQDDRLAHHSLQESRREVDKLKRQLQDYVNEVRRVEELLAHKEEERTDMLEHFRSLSVEATALETNNQSLESEREEALVAVQVAEQQATEMQQHLLDREAAVMACETQISELTVKVAGLEAQLHEQLNKCERQEGDLEALRQLCVDIERQKETLSEEAAETDIRKIHLEREVEHLREEQEVLQQQLLKDRAAISALEDMLASSRREALEHRTTNQSLQSEVARLQDELDGESAEKQRLASQAAALDKQVIELQREVTNEKFNNARAAEDRSMST